MAPFAQQLQLAALGLMLICLGMLLVPVSYHCIVLSGRNTGELHRLATATVSTGLLPFALAMSVSAFLGARWVTNTLYAGIFAGLLLAVTLACWYGWELVARRQAIEIDQRGTGGISSRRR